jgi:hypothetical protein
MKKYLLLTLVFLSNNILKSQVLLGGQKNYTNFNIGEQWFFKQNILKSKFSNDSYILNKQTFYLKEDNNNDGIPDKKWYLSLNTVNNSTQDLFLFTMPSENTIGTEISIYEEYYNTINVFDGVNTISLKDINAFYRQSKVCPPNTTVRTLSSLPILFQAPSNTSIHSCTLQIIYTVRVANFDKVNKYDVSSYQYFKVDGLSDFGTNLISNYLEIQPNGSLKSITQNNNLVTNKIEWGKEYVKSKVIYELTLYW